MPKQLPLNLQLKPHYDRDHFIEAAANAMAMETIDQFSNWPAQVMILIGPKGSGKTHMAHIWAEDAGAEFIKAEDFNADNAQNLHPKNFVIDGLMDGVGDMQKDAPFDEVALFHLFNAARQHQTFGLITSQSLPQNWVIKLPDLKSRLKAAPKLEIFEPDDLLLQQVMYKLFADRQLTVDQGVIEYLTLRMERSLSAAEALVNHLDKEALAEGRKITKPMASSCLKTLQMS